MPRKKAIFIENNESVELKGHASEVAKKCGTVMNNPARKLVQPNKPLSTDLIRLQDVEGYPNSTQSDWKMHDQKSFIYHTEGGQQRRQPLDVNSIQQSGLVESDEEEDNIEVKKL